MEKLFEKAVRSKLRFNFRGLISVEDLWDLSIESLDGIYKNLNTELKSSEGDSLLKTETNEDKELQLKIEIVKYVFQVKYEEKQAKINEALKRQQKQKIIDIIESKKEQDLQNKSVEELEEIANNL